jgi:crossover junction endodeoxyribonuclease RuvC
MQETTIKGVAAGVWKLDEKMPLAARLAALAIEFRRTVQVFQPTHLCLELAFLADNARSALFLGHARGVILSEGHQCGLEISEISATSAKKMITNYGRADKQSVAKMVSHLLSINIDNLPFDATDALGIAYSQALREQQHNMTVHASKHLSAEQKDVLAAWTAGRKKGRKKQVGFESLIKRSS